jgi:phospholipase/lecithinase/hemolysin
MHLLQRSYLYPLATFYAAVRSASAATHSQFDVVVAFGDSWLDNVCQSRSSRLDRLTLRPQGNGTWIQTNHTIPGDPAFWEGRLSNGPTWVEGLTDLLGAKQLLDYAHGGGKPLPASPHLI